MGDTYHVLEVSHDAIQANAEAGGFEFLGRGCPFHVDAACVADEGFAHVEAEATEEEDEPYDYQLMHIVSLAITAAYHRRPLDGLPKTDEECLLAKAVTKHGICER